MQIRFIKISEISLVEQLFSDLVSPHHIFTRDRDLLKWQFRSNLIDGAKEDELSILGAFQNDQLIGLMGLIGHRHKHLGEVQNGAWIANWYVRPESRSGAPGIFLLKKGLELGGAAISCLGYNQNSHDSFTAFRFETISTLPRLVATFDQKTCSDFLAQGFPSISRQMLQEICHERSVNSPATIKLETIHEKKAKSWNSTWENLSQSFIGASRDFDYLSWRYLNHPHFKYEILVCTDGQKINGLTVIRIEKIENGMKVARIVEFLEDESVEDLASGIVNWCVDNKIAYADFNGTYLKSLQKLEQVGFKRDLETGPRFPSRLQGVDYERFYFPVALWVKNKEQNLLSHPDLYVTKSDGDMDRPR